ncbi:MAG: phytanoyl-CoA dioxygenase family protein [Myxococcales bacterium]|nr:phytanoyl-CoA dioxygenase family protein [Myxococcales bacterium]
MTAVTAIAKPMEPPCLGAERVAASFHRDGFAVLRNVLLPEDVSTLRAELAQFAAVAMAHGGHHAAGHGGGPVWQIVSPHHHRPRVLHALRQQRLARVAAACLGAHTLQMLQEVLLIKPARIGGSIGWHQDRTYAGYFDPPNLLSIRIALGAEDQAHGGLRVLKGSHRWPIPHTSDYGASELTDTGYATACELMGPEAVSGAEQRVELRPGDVSLHHCRTLHSSGPNRSDADRLTVVAHVFDPRAKLVIDAVPPQLRTRFVGDGQGRLSEAEFPLLTE